MKIHQKIIFLFLNLGTLIIHSQKLNPIQLDRPDQTETVYTVPKAYLQVESGFRLEHVTRKENRYEFPSVLWKYGLTNTIELRLITDLARENGEIKIRPFSLGFKTKLMEEQGILPKISLIAHLMVQSPQNTSPKSTFVTPRFRFTFQNNLSKNSSIGYNLGMEWNTENSIPTYIYTLTYGRSLNEYLGAYIETYGFYSQNTKADSRIDGGITYLVNSNFMIDFSSGFGLSEISPKYFVALGLSFRIQLKK